MFSTSDTIVAVATPAGRGGLGVVRLSGPEASRIACGLLGRNKPLKPRHATFAEFVESGTRSQISTFVEKRDLTPNSTSDHVVVTLFLAPASYTGEDVVEISAHGSPVVLTSIVRAAVNAGARLAEPGEFTLRGFLNNKFDLIQAEAVADLIDAVTPLQARAAFDQLEGTLTSAITAIDQELFDTIAKLEASLDFPDEGYHFVAPMEARESVASVIAQIDTLLKNASRGRMIREGAAVAIVGAPNVGKSSLFNTLLNANRAIVTAIPGTTRDLLTEQADIGGLSLSLIDTAGVRETSDVIERISARIDELEESLQAAIRSESASLRAESATLRDELRAEIRTESASVRDELRAEICAESAGVKTELRAEIRAESAAVQTELRAEIRDGLAENRRHAEVLHESLRDDIRILAGLSTKLDSLQR